MKLFRAGTAWSLRARGALWAFFVAAVPIALVLVAAVHTHQRQIDASSRSYGQTIAAQLAALSAGPLVTHDPLALNVITTHLSSARAIRNVAVFTLDDRLVNTGGRTPVEATRAAPVATVFMHDITFEAQKIGYVRVVIDPDELAPSVTNALLPATVIGLVFALWLGARAGGALESTLTDLVTRLRALLPDLAPRTTRPTSAVADLAALADELTPAPPEPVVTPPPATAPPYVLVLNLFNQGALAPRDRDAVYTACEAAIARVLELYKGRSMRLPGTGFATTLDMIEGEDHAFSAISAALLTLRLASNSCRDAGFEKLVLRGGLARASAPVPVRGSTALDTAARESLEDDIAIVVTLSATATNGALAIARDVFEALQNNHRVQWAAIRSPIAQRDDGGRFHYQINGLAATQNALLDAQAAKLTLRVAG